MENTLDPKVLTFLKKYQIKFEVFQCNPDFADTYQFCEEYGFKLSQSANTIIIAGKTEPIKYAVCIALASTKLDVNHKVCEKLGIKKASFATPEQTRELTGMQIGGVTVFGIENLPILIDDEVLVNEKIVMGGGNRSSKVLIDPQELRKIPSVEFVKDLAIPKV